MIPHRAADRYAGALYELAAEQGCLDDVVADLRGLGSAVLSCPELAAFLPDYTLPDEVRSRVLQAILGMRAHPLVRRFLEFLESKRRLGLLVGVCRAAEERHERERGVVKVLLVTAVPLRPASIEAIAARLREGAVGPLRLDVQVDPRLIGGFLYRVGDTVHDHSIRNALRSVREQLAGA